MMTLTNHQFNKGMLMTTIKEHGDPKVASNDQHNVGILANHDKKYVLSMMGPQVELGATHVKTYGCNADCGG